MWKNKTIETYKGPNEDETAKKRQRGVKTNRKE